MDATETRDFPTDVMASLSTGIVLCEDGFSKMHEAAEYLMGHPIWTHHFASKELWQDMRKTILAQHPKMPTDASGIEGGNWRAYRDTIVAKLGATVTIKKGGGLTALLPTDGIPDHLKDSTIVVTERG